MTLAKITDGKRGIEIPCFICRLFHKIAAMQIGALRDLRYFVEVARRASFNIAAVKLSVTTGAVSKAVTRLEQQMDVPLFIRTSRAIRLSAEGAKLFQQTSTLFDSLEGSMGAVRQEAQSISGMIHLSTFTMFGRTRLPSLLARFTAEHPHVEFVVSFHDKQRGVSRDMFDIRITAGERLDTDKIACVLCRLRLVTVASPDYIARFGWPETPAELAGHHCVNGLMPDGGKGRWLFRRRGEAEEPQIAVHPKGFIAVMDEMNAVTDLVRHGLGVSLVEAYDAAPHLLAGTLVQLLPDYEVSAMGSHQDQAVMQYRRRHKLNRAAAAFVDFLIANTPGDEAP